MKNPWKTLSTRLVYENSWIRLREDQVITPAGAPGIYSVVEVKPALGIVALTEDLQTYLVGQYRYPLGVYSWEIPEGGGKVGESLIETARRELKEETGLEAETWTLLGDFYTSNCIMNEVATIYMAENLHQGQSKPDDTEELTIKLVPFKQAYQMVLDGEIKDSMAIFGLLQAHNLLTKQGRLK